jgi:hypothetical protein
MLRPRFICFATSSKYSWGSGITFKQKNHYREIDFWRFQNESKNPGGESSGGPGILQFVIDPPLNPRRRTPKPSSQLRTALERERYQHRHRASSWLEGGFHLVSELPHCGCRALTGPGRRTIWGSSEFFCIGVIAILLYGRWGVEGASRGGVEYLLSWVTTITNSMLAMCRFSSNIACSGTQGVAIFSGSNGCDHACLLRAAAYPLECDLLDGESIRCSSDRPCCF